MLYPHQSNLLEKNPPKIILAWATSLGKTLALIELAKKNTDNILIICPKSLKARWQRDMPEADVYTKEEFKKKWKDLRPYKGIIIDEIHHFSGNSQMHKALVDYIKKYYPKFVWGASATPYRSTPWNVFHLARIMGYEWNYVQFRNAFFGIQYLGKRMIWVPKKDADSQTRLTKALKQFCDVVSAEEANMPPEDVFEEEVFNLTKDQERRISKLEIEEPNPVVKYGKEHQIAQGFIKGDEFNETEFISNEKIPRLIELAVEHPSMLIFCKYTYQIIMITEALRREGHTVFALRGEVSMKDRDEIIQTINKSEEDYILVCQTALGEGWEAPRFDFVVFASLPWSFVDYTQCIGRASRVNVPKRRTYLTLTVADSIDESVKEALENKKDFQIELYEHN